VTEAPAPATATIALPPAPVSQPLPHIDVAPAQIQEPGSVPDERLARLLAPPAPQLLSAPAPAASAPRATVPPTTPAASTPAPVRPAPRAAAA
jgi:hypothetical protein